MVIKHRKVLVPLLMRCHLNVKQTEPQPHAEIRYEVTTGCVCACGTEMDDGGRRRRRAATLVAQGPAFRFADSYSSRGRSKSGISRVDLSPTVLYSVSYAAATFLRLPDLPPPAPPVPPPLPPPPPSCEDCSPPGLPALHFDLTAPLTAVLIINTDTKQIGRRDATRAVSFSLSHLQDVAPTGQRKKKQIICSRFCLLIVRIETQDNRKTRSLRGCACSDKLDLTLMWPI